MANEMQEASSETEMPVPTELPTPTSPGGPASPKRANKKTKAERRRRPGIGGYFKIFIVAGSRRRRCRRSRSPLQAQPKPVACAAEEGVAGAAEEGVAWAV